MNETKKVVNRKLVFSTIVYVIVLILIVVFICLLDKQYDYSLSQNEQSYKFGASYMTMNNPFFEVINESIRTTVEANGDILITRDPALDAERQIEQIQDLIDENVDAIFVAPVDYERVIPAIQKAREKGIIIIFVDTEVYDETLADSMVVSDNYLAGAQCAEYIMEQKPYAKILILEHDRTKSANDRVEGFMDTLEGHDSYRIVGKQDAEGQLEVAMPLMSDIVQSDLDFDTVFAINDLSALGAMAALKDSGKLSEVAVLGVDGAPEAKAMIKENLMMATSAQYPTQIGEYAVEQAYKILRKETYEKKILVPVDLVTKDNVEQYGTGNWQ